MLSSHCTPPHLIPRLAPSTISSFLHPLASKTSPSTRHVPPLYIAEFNFPRSLSRLNPRTAIFRHTVVPLGSPFYCTTIVPRTHPSSHSLVCTHATHMAAHLYVLPSASSWNQIVPLDDYPRYRFVLRCGPCLSRDVVAVNAIYSFELQDKLVA